MVIGCLGSIVFRVSEDIVRTLNNMAWSGSARYAVHERHLTDALTEFTGLDPEKITFDITLCADLGTDPFAEVMKIRNIERSGKSVPLTIGSRSYGKYRWNIIKHEMKMKAHYHAGDGVIRDGGNMTSIAIEVIMNDNPANDAKAKDNAARLAAALMDLYGFSSEKLVTHTFWVAKAARKTETDVDEQCTTLIYGKKWCPAYIFGSTSHATALKNWKAFKALVAGYRKDGAAQGAEIPAVPKAPLRVRITGRPNIRKGPSTNHAVTGVVDKPGVYTITEVSDGPGASGWGKLKSGAGWVSLDFCAKI